MGCWYCYQIGPVRRPGMGSCRGSSPSLCSAGFVIYKLMYYYFCVAREIPTLTVDVILTLLRPSFFFLSIHQAFAMYTTWVSSYWTSIKSLKKKTTQNTTEQACCLRDQTILFCQGWIGSTLVWPMHTISMSLKINLFNRFRIRQGKWIYTHMWQWLLKHLSIYIYMHWKAHRLCI